MRYNRRKSTILTIINDLANQSAAGYITYNPTDKKFFLPPENAMVLANEDSSAFMLGAYQMLRSIFKDEDKFVEIFKSGKGLHWSEHHHDLFEGVAKFFKPNYMSNLVSSWIPSLDGMQEKQTRCKSCRYWIWLWNLYCNNGKSLSKFQVLWF